MTPPDYHTFTVDWASDAGSNIAVGANSGIAKACIPASLWGDCPWAVCPHGTDVAEYIVKLAWDQAQHGAGPSYHGIRRALMFTQLFPLWIPESGILYLLNGSNISLEYRSTGPLSRVELLVTDTRAELEVVFNDACKTGYVNIFNSSYEEDLRVLQWLQKYIPARPTEIFTPNPRLYIPGNFLAFGQSYKLPFDTYFTGMAIVACLDPKYLPQLELGANPTDVGFSVIFRLEKNKGAFVLEITNRRATVSFIDSLGAVSPHYDSGYYRSDLFDAISATAKKFEELLSMRL